MEDSLVEAKCNVLLAGFVNTVNDILGVFLDSLACRLATSVYETWGVRNGVITYILKVQKQKHAGIHRTNNTSWKSSNDREEEWKLLHYVSRCSCRLDRLYPDRREVWTIQVVPAAIQCVKRDNVCCQTHIDLTHRHWLA
jgi:hypothetical protein